MITTKQTIEQPFKAFEHRGWNHSAKQYSETFTRLTDQTIPEILTRLNLTDTTSFLDVSTGCGKLAGEAYKVTRKVTAIDFSEEMLALARSSFSEIDFRQGDAEHLPFTEERFDAVAMNFGMLHLGEPEKAMSEAYRVLNQDGRFAFTVWAPPERAVGFQVVLSAIKAHGDMSVPLPEGPPFFRYSDPDVSLTALKDAGFSRLQYDELPLQWVLSDAEEFFKAFHEGTARTGGLLRAQTPQRLQAIRADVKKQIESQYRFDNEVRIPMPAMLYVGTRE